MSEEIEKMKNSTRAFSGIREIAAGPAARFYVFATFVGVVFFMGGGSRDDIQSLVVLRPLAVLFCAYALVVKVSKQWKGRLAPLYIVSSLSILMVVQLVPLPPSIWAELSGRQIFADIAATAELAQPWRPLTLSPSNTLNSLFSLAVPIAAIMLYLNLDKDDRKRTLTVIVVFCLVSALWGMLQMAGPSRGPLYLYHITNFSTGVGLFANRNHQAILLASTILMLGWYASSIKQNSVFAGLKYAASIAAMLALVPVIATLGSRAGLLLMVPSIGLAITFMYLARYRRNSETHDVQASQQSIQSSFISRVIFAISALSILGIVILSLLFSQSLAVDRLLGTDEASEMRIHLLPTLLTMIETYMPWGSGFGSFEHVYKIFEPQDLLSTKYLNQAHSDWLQFVIEGGIPAILIAIGASIWFLTRLGVLVQNWHVSKSMTYQALFCVSVISIFLISSVFDYPLRVPSIVAIFVIFGCIFDDAIHSLQRKSRQSR